MAQKKEKVFKNIYSSSLIYFIEHDAQPEVFSDIPSSMWWGVVTLTTIGYGDTYPITPLGKFLGSIVIRYRQSGRF